MRNQHSAHIAVFNKKKQILLIKRRDIPVWVIPGGRAEKNEKPIDTAIREFLEETGVRLSPSHLLLVAHYTSTISSQRSKYLYSVRLSKAIKPILTEESSAYGFFNLEDLPEPLSQYEKRKIYEAHIKVVDTPLVRPDTVNYLLEIRELLSRPLVLLELLFKFFLVKLKERL